MPTNSIEEIIKKYALINAVEHEGVAQAKSVLGKILGEHPELRENVLELRSNVELIVDQINRLSTLQQKRELELLGGYTPIKRIEKKVLPELELTREKFVVRFAPNPDGAIHLGNARPAILCDEYAKKYHGRFILRFDDTDPKIKVPEKKFYKWIKEDLKWFGIKVHQEIIASKRLKIYYKFADKIIRIGGAYVCTCNIDEWKKLRDKSQACPCREMNIKTHLNRWKKMLLYKYKEGEAVLRIKTELDAKNPALRDWAAFRIVDNPQHPINKKAHLWPLYNFASAIDDHLCKITHIFRAQEHTTNEFKQRYLYEHFKWDYPIVITLGRFSLSNMVLSKSQIREGIRKKIYTGWDDPKLGTIRALRRRGFQPEALRQIIVDIGPKSSDITISYENLSAYNRKIIDKIANRYFFIPNPKKIEVKNMKLKKAKIPLHPEEKRGYRTFSLSKTFYIDKNDFDTYKGLEIRLKDLCNIKLGEKSEFTDTELRPLPKIQWVPEKHIHVKVIMPDKEIKGIAETNLLKAKVGNVVQFERFGFVKIEKIINGNVLVIFGHE
ncbi:MAG: glutamate--tRNA ligase [Candidatus Aenigmatarchaeota archaeon]